jgi:hypothetical protein
MHNANSNACFFLALYAKVGETEDIIGWKLRWKFAAALEMQAQM